jgi:undecaprenyl-diphosphatase
MLAGFGIPMIFIDSVYKRNTEQYKTLKITQAIFIGVAQSIALISGVSRSGITIMAALMIGLSKDEAKEYSFLASIPVILGSFLIEALDVIHSPLPESIPVVITGIIFSFIGGYIAIKFFMDYLSKHSLRIFGIYRIALAVILYFMFFFK